MLPKYDPFEDPILTRGLDPTTLLTIRTLTKKAKLRWENFQGTANSAVLGAAALFVAVFSILHWTVPCLVTLALFLPVRYGVRAVGHKILVRSTLEDIRRYGDRYRR